jgi:Fe-S cluster assembly scaffold protein SufB
MSKRKRRQQFFDLFNFDKEDFLFGREPIEGGSGYSISVAYGEEDKLVVRVEAHGDVDVTELRRDIEERYPGARIEGLEKQQLIRIVDEQEEKKKTEWKRREDRP